MVPQALSLVKLIKICVIPKIGAESNLKANEEFPRVSQTSSSCSASVLVITGKLVTALCLVPHLENQHQIVLGVENLWSLIARSLVI